MRLENCNREFVTKKRPVNGFLSGLSEVTVRTVPRIITELNVLQSEWYVESRFLHAVEGSVLYSGVESPEKTARHQKLSLLAARITEDRLSGILLSHGANDEASVGLQIVSDTRVNGLGYSKTFGESMYIDADHAFVLTDGQQTGQPICIVGIDFEADALTIKQLQGVKGQGDRMGQLGRWERTLVTVVEQTAAELGIPEVRIRPAEQMGYVQIGRLPLAKAKARYDVTAKRMGYDRDKNSGFFVKKLNGGLPK